MLKERNIAVSLCNNVYENAHIERLNGIMKNEYLYPAKIKNFRQLLNVLNESVYFYNSSRIHYSLKMVSPIDFEDKLSNLPATERQVLTIWSDIKNIRPVQMPLFK
jgi:transposase InsO family protein